MNRQKRTVTRVMLAVVMSAIMATMPFAANAHPLRDELADMIHDAQILVGETQIRAYGEDAPSGWWAWEAEHISFRSALDSSVVAVNDFDTNRHIVQPTTGVAVRPLGRGTAEEPFLISTPENFIWMDVARWLVARSHLVLTNNIAIDRSHVWRFDGTFDGQGYTIYTTNPPVFSLIGNDAIIGNLHTADCITRDERESTGRAGLVNINGGLIFNSSSSVNIITAGTNTLNRQVGGLVGSNTGTIINSYASGTVTGNREVGGLAGYNSHGGTIINSFASGNVSGNRHVGSLVGLQYYGNPSIYQSAAFGNVEWINCGSGWHNWHGAEPVYVPDLTDEEIRRHFSIGGIVGENRGGVICSEPPEWFWMGRRVTASPAHRRRPELSDHEREAIDRANALFALMDYVRQVDWETDELEGAFGGGELTAIQREVLEQHLESRALIEQLYQEREANPRETPIRRPPGRDTPAWTDEQYAEWGLSPGDHVPSWDQEFIESYQASTLRYGGRSIIGFAFGFNPLTPDFITEAAVDVAINITIGVAEDTGLAEQGRVNMNFLDWLLG